ncbi:Uncharacterized protein BP5553_03318 [Venustampulla echinocandica]|uniref:Meiotic recombination protein DMC1 n=1 Tax=Venustampulla echinocandica TaxID=2656787 RepID=A0A370TU07_9HELO|nr:Uncharacterized protein BP5553_03318 [Venustampulla echinocandica]RDL38978.1 Uncharacterized protein BP5553_03318 [Venustampulla echinocandica]
MDEAPNASGGFLRTSLPSPSPSNASISSTSSNLPQPRAHPLRPGSAKEDAARRYVEGRLLHISRRYTKKFQEPLEGEEVHGYESMSDAAKDLGEVIDILWLSGTPSLQVPYLLNVALMVTTYLTAFPPAPSATFKLLRKLDHSFSSLLKGADSVTGDPLPWVQAGKKAGMSKTDMIRCKSLVESTRVLVVEVMSNPQPPGMGFPEESGVDTTDAGSGGDASGAWTDEEDKHDMDVARVYERTIVQLNEVLVSETAFHTGSGQS